MNYSPKLKNVIAQIKQIMEENDLAGFVTLVEPGFSEYISVINPTWSAAFFDGFTLRVKTKGLPLMPSEKREMLAITANMLLLLSTTTMEQGMALAAASEWIDGVIGAEHGDRGHTSQTSIDN